MKYSYIKTIKGRFLLIVIILTLVIGTSVTTLSYTMFYQNLRKNIIHSTETSLQFLSSDIADSLDDIFTLCHFFHTNQEILNFVMTGPESEKYNSKTRIAKDRMEDEIRANSSSSYIQRIVVANTERTDYIQTIHSSEYSIERPLVQIIQELSYFEDLLYASTYSFDFGFQKDEFLKSEILMLPVIRPIYHPYNTSCIGFVYIQISPTLFTDAAKEYTLSENTPIYLTLSENVYEIMGSSITLVTQEYELSTITSSDLLNDDTLLQEISVNGDTNLVVTRPLSVSGCYISQIISGNVFQTQSNEYLTLLFFIIVFILIIGIFLIAILSRIVNRPIASLQNRLKEVAQGDFTIDHSIEWNNEFGDIGKNINQLATDIQALLQKTIEDERQKNEYEYKMLQSQINPHFLYNTLNSVKWMATVQNAPGIAEMVTALSRLLKSISKGTSAVVTIADEISLLDDYFTIQKYRYGGTITLHYQIDDELITQNKILRFTLQPIVENAIFHGIEPKGHSGDIEIHIFYTQTADIQIDITDNGIGMDKETIARLLSKDEYNTGNAQFFKGIGINSVNKRLQYTFGNKYGLRITSVVGEYTTMSILLPGEV